MIVNRRWGQWDDIVSVFSMILFSYIIIEDTYYIMIRFEYIAIVVTAIILILIFTIPSKGVPYDKQANLMLTRYKSMGDKRRPLSDLLKDSDEIPASQQSFVNFHMMSMRFTGCIGPFENGYFDPENAVNYAVLAGTRCFVLDIDYLDNCPTEYFPCIVVRDTQNRYMLSTENRKKCENVVAKGSIEQVSNCIAKYAFGSGVQNKDDPVVVVLNFLRVPPRDADKAEYFSRVALSLQPLQSRFLQNEPDGHYYRQEREDKLLTNPISRYYGKVLVFSNADTSIFREENYRKNDVREDLDYFVNMTLSYTQTPLGATGRLADGKAAFGSLDSFQGFLVIPTKNVDSTINRLKLQWTIALSDTPHVFSTKEQFNQITDGLGVHSVPTALFDDGNDYLFKDDWFGTYSFKPKKDGQRYVLPPTFIPGEPSKKLDANGGMLRSPTLDMK